MTPQQQTEAKRLPHLRTLEMVAAAKVASFVASVPDSDPRRLMLQRKLREMSAKIRAQELNHEAGQ
jgi:hypothetical protein